MTLLPAFSQVVLYYLRTPLIKRDIKYYGDGHWRHALDIYSPETRTSNGRPVVVFVSGGAWMLGYKAWSVMMAVVFQSLGYVFVSIDYRNFPENTVEAAVQDAGLAINWVFDNIKRYGGDPNNVFLCGQSAGAHLISNVVVRKALYDSGVHPDVLGEERPETVVQLDDEKSEAMRHDEDESVPADVYLAWPLAKVRGVMLISGMYDLVNEKEYMMSKGVLGWVIEAICGGNLLRFSPTSIIRSAIFTEDAARLLPDISLYHGSMDTTAPPVCTEKLEEALRHVGHTAEATYYPTKKHTDPIIEDVILRRPGENDVLVVDLLKFMKSRLSESEDNWDESHGKEAPEMAGATIKHFLVPTFVVKFAQWVNPL